MSTLTAEHESILAQMSEANPLPTIPAVALSFLRMAQDPEASIRKMAKLMALDPALAVKTLRYANSCYYAASHPIVNLEQALVRIGMRGATMLALSFSLVQACEGQAKGGFDYAEFWHGSLTASVAARRIAELSVRKLADQAFVGALLCDIGRPVLYKGFPGKYHLVLKKHQLTRMDLASLESKMLGISHAEIGAALLHRWQIPDMLVKAVAAHHNIDGLSPEAEEFALAVVICAAGKLASIITQGGTDAQVAELAAMFKKYFSLSANEINVVLGAMSKEVESIADMLKIQLPGVDAIEEKARAEMLRVSMAKTD